MALVVPIQLPSWLATTPTAITKTQAFSGKLYRLRFFWDIRVLPARTMREGQEPKTGGWRIDLSDITGNPLLLGLKVVLTDDVWQLFHHRDTIPPGALRIRRTDGGNTDPGLYDLGTAVAVEYVVD